VDAHKLIVAAVQQQMMNFAVWLEEDDDESRILERLLSDSRLPFHKLTGVSHAFGDLLEVLAWNSTAS
jgi:hypothetical protein